MSDPRLRMILDHLDPPAGAKLWHGGASVLGSLRGVPPEEAAWRPSPDRHSIWALTLHIAYWKYAVTRKITGGPRGEFPRRPSNWPAVPDPPSGDAWKQDRALLRTTHQRLVESVRGLDPKLLDEVPDGRGGYTWRDILLGIVLHDIHHAGQIVMLKRLYGSLGGAEA